MPITVVVVYYGTCRWSVSSKENISMHKKLRHSLSHHERTFFSSVTGHRVVHQIDGSLEPAPTCTILCPTKHFLYICADLKSSNYTTELSPSPCSKWNVGVSSCGVGGAENRTHDTTFFVGHTKYSTTPR